MKEWLETLYFVFTQCSLKVKEQGEEQHLHTCFRMLSRFASTGAFRTTGTHPSLT